MIIDRDGWLVGEMQVPSPNCDKRPDTCAIDLVVVHAISLPPEQFGGPSITALFTNSIDPALHPYFEALASLKVSAHVLIRRDGRLIQFVPFLRRAWHAGHSSWQGRERCNDFSVGIELEGSDLQAFAPEQYRVLDGLILLLKAVYQVGAVSGHSDVSPGRKTDPGPHFDWMLLSSLSRSMKII